ncbi:hypothetical protein CDD80_1490 [Ophiocordyceps camponoti-rufipedis]|uniref:MMS19 nucleotide excision repair protein n=1 Tax=Ophiocordyceps camponoti-rufipedis TaxID=2004952 RepID=A0A2C5XM05_9HYPO|nr:hypothetical protein CDD80_1490 [Ophiocordyceps camponoti-rufipedis]
MADFRQLALDFILEDDEAAQTSIARRAASEIESAPAASNPVARWVEAVQPWMPASDDDAMRDDGDVPDWTTRAKALEFLSRTLLLLDQTLLKPSQVNLLIAFFGAMFDVDHKAGIMASATALSRIITMKSFQPSSGRTIIQMLCALKEDFPRQAPKTRLAVYRLVRSLVTDAAVARDLKSDKGDGAFMKPLLSLCQNERDPECLMIWLDTLRFYAAEYSPSEEVLNEVYGAFRAYFPITVPRASQSGLTPEELKLQLRHCFSSNGLIAPLTLPFLLDKLDQGEGVIVNVKVDILRTLRACLEEYTHPEQSVAPYTGKIWDSLKHEVRNGDVEDTIWATLEVLKALTTRLQGDTLREFALTVTRECVGDLSNQAYAAAAGRLLVSVLSADARAFALMASPAIAHIKENLRHPKSSTHKLDLLKILRILLETRLLLADMEMPDPERQDFGATDSVFRPLYGDVYRTLVESTDETDDVKVVTEAVQGAAALVCQRPSSQTPSHTELLLPEATCAQICDVLFSIAARSWELQSRQSASHELINESIKALRRATEAYPLGFQPLMERGLAIIRDSYGSAVTESVSTIQRVSSVVAFVGCSTLRPSMAHAMRCFLALTCVLTLELSTAMEMKRDAHLWCALVAGIEMAVHFFRDAFSDVSLEDPSRSQRLQGDESLSRDSWLTNIMTKYPVLSSMESASAPSTFDTKTPVIPEVVSAFEVRDDFLLVGLAVCRHLYRKATKPVEHGHGFMKLGLADGFSGADPEAAYRHLSMVSDLASFIVGEMSRYECPSPPIETYFLTLFHDNLIPLPSSLPAGDIQPQGSWDWLAIGPLSVLSWGILRSMPPSGVARLYEMGVAQRILLDGISSTSHSGPSSDSLPVTRAILAVLANKYKLEAVDAVMTVIEQQAQSTFTSSAIEPNQEDQRQRLDQALTIFTLAGSLARRSTGPRTRALLELLQRAPQDAAVGYRLARGLELVVAPQTFLTDSAGSVQRPLWMQKVYVDLVKPMMAVASRTSSVDVPISRSTQINYGIAVLSMVNHMRFPVYEEDTAAIIRIAISTAQHLGIGPDTRAALEVITCVLGEAPDAVQDHLGSLVSICIGLSSEKPPTNSQTDEEDDDESRVGCAKLSLEMIGRLPQTLESRHLFAHAPAVRRHLASACGHGVRELRRLARVARATWADLK